MAVAPKKQKEFQNGYGTLVSVETGNPKPAQLAPPMVKILSHTHIAQKTGVPNWLARSVGGKHGYQNLRFAAPGENVEPLFLFSF